MLPEALKRPLVFGDAEQIEALRLLALKAEFKALPACAECEGESECSKCGHECDSCGGSGKDEDAYQKFRATHHLTGFQTAELRGS